MLAATVSFLSNDTSERLTSLCGNTSVCNIFSLPVLQHEVVIDLTTDGISVQALITMAGSRPVPLLDERHFRNLEVDDFFLRGDELECEEQRERPGALAGPSWQEQEPPTHQHEQQQHASVPGGRGSTVASRVWDGQCNGRAVHVEAELAAAGLPRIAIEVRRSQHLSVNCPAERHCPTSYHETNIIRCLGQTVWSNSRDIKFPRRARLIMMLSERSTP